MNLQLENCRGQCNDGASSNMRGTVQYPEILLKFLRKNHVPSIPIVNSISHAKIQYAVLRVASHSNVCALPVYATNDNITCEYCLGPMGGYSIFHDCRR